MTQSCYRWLNAAVQDGALVVTSSRRLARELGTVYDAGQLAAGRTAWPTPAIRYWHDWLTGEFAESAQPGLPRLLDTASAMLLWEDSIRDSGRHELLSPAGFVRQARQAWQRLHDWHVSPEQVRASAFSHDERWYARASAGYAERLRDGGWIDSAELAARCTALFTEGVLAAPRRLVHTGFDRLTPALGALFEKLAELGATVSAAPRRARPAARTYRSYADATAQWRAAGRWARQTLEREPEARIALVATDLEADAATVARLVREGFAPGWQLGGPAFREAVNASYGRRLLDFPLLAIAERCVRFAALGLPASEVGVLLRTPFLGDGESGGSSRLELALRAMPDRSWQPDGLLRALSDTDASGGNMDWLQALAEVQAERNERHAPPEWARRIDALLERLGWPGRRPSDSDEFQLVNRWRQLLNELAGVAAVRPQLTLPEALHQLCRIAADTVYQPEAPASGLRLLGALEAAGMEFDYLWVGGLDAGRWPPPAHPLALVSRRLQRDAGMPDATPGDTLQYARGVLDRLCTAAREVWLSWPRGDDSDAVLLPSPLLHAPPDAVSRDRGDPGWHGGTLLGEAPLRAVADDTVPAVATGEKIRGGAYTVQRMRSDPFAAFAAGRLAAGVLEPMQAGLTPRLRGKALHKALQVLFDERPTRQEIAAWSPGDRAARIERAAYRALARLRAHADPVLVSVLQLEKSRLAALLERFVAHEIEREDFRIAAVEQPASLRHGPVTVELRIDRVDRLADGRLLVADYKSGSRKPFMDTRRDAPADLQLCIYARALGGSAGGVGGLMLIHIDSREIVYLGEGGSVPWGRLDGELWDETLERWCSEVDALLARFAAGDAGVNLRQPADEARPLAILSRVEELRRVD